MREIMTEELVLILGKAYTDVAFNNSEVECNGWASIEAFAKITGYMIRSLAQKGEHETVMQGAMNAMLEGYQTLQPEEFLGPVASRLDS